MGPNGCTSSWSMRKSRNPDGRRPPAAVEADLWAHAMRDVRRLPGRRAAPPPAPLSPPTKPIELSARPTSAPRAALPELASGHTPGLDGRTAARLRRGEIAIEARLDLHGMTQEQAHKALAGFVKQAHADGLRCVLVITGKGMRGAAGREAGVLRAGVPKWLNGSDLRPKMLAFAPAKARHGGEGALYLLLKRARERT